MRSAWLVVLLTGCGAKDREPEVPATDASLVDADRFPDARLQGLHLGTVSVTEDIYEGESTTIQAVMTVYENARRHRRDEGPCRFEYIESFGTSARVNAGRLVLTGGTQSPITMVVAGNGGYAAVGDQEFLFPTGAAVTVTAEGGAAPAFKAAGTFPASVTVTSPAAGGPTVVAVDRDGMQVTWTPTTESVVVRLDQEVSMYERTAIECTFDGTSGVAVMEGWMLAPLVEGLPPTATYLTVQTVKRSVVQVGVWEMTLETAFVGSRHQASISAE